MSLVRQGPYSPDLAPCDFWLFPKLETILNGKRFQSREDIMKKSTEELESILEKEFKSLRSGKSVRKSVCTAKENTLKEME